MRGARSLWKAGAMGLALGCSRAGPAGGAPAKPAAAGAGSPAPYPTLATLGALFLGLITGVNCSARGTSKDKRRQTGAEGHT